MNILVSFAHILQHPEWRKVLHFLAEQGVTLMVDSGAFSAVMAGRVIDHDEYIALVKEFQGYPNIEFVQLDKPKDPEATAVQLARERALGLNTMPVLTANAPVEDFVRIVQQYGPRVCLAGGQNEGAPRFLARCKACNEAVRGQAQIHALGFTKQLVPLACEAYSFDSASWAAAGMWGSMTVWDPAVGFVNIKRQDIHKHSFNTLPRAIRETLMSSGIPRDTMLSGRGWTGGRSVAQYLTIDCWLRYAAQMERAGKRFLFAVVYPQQVATIILACEHAMNKGVSWTKIDTDEDGIWSAMRKTQLNFDVVGKHLAPAMAKWKAMCGNAP